MATSRLLFLLAIVAAGPAPAQTLYKCVADGKTSYQSEPCAARARQSEIAAPRPAAAPEPKDEPAKPGPEAAGMPAGELDLVVDTFAGYTICSEADLGFGARHAFGFDGWKERNAALLERFNRDPAAAQALQSRLQQERQRQEGDPAAARAARIELCARVAERVKPRKPQP
jgi:hypothetical protein